MKEFQYLKMKISFKVIRSYKKKGRKILFSRRRFHLTDSSC